MINRRAFVAGAAATLVAVPRVAWGQDRVVPIRLAVMSSGFTAEEMTESGTPRWRAFFGELRRLGLVEGENLIVERWSNAGRPSSELSDLARLLVARRPDLIFVQAARAAAAVKAATATIPAVFVGGTPLVWGLGESLARPGGNLTGFSDSPGPEIFLKQLQLLREAVPGPEPVAYLVTPNSWETSAKSADLREGAPRLGITLVPTFVEEPVDEHSIARAFAALPEWPNRVMYVSPSAAFTANARAIAAEAFKAGIPAIYHLRALADAGLLMTYGRDLPAQYAEAAGYVARIARGEDPAEMPIQLPSKFDFVINLKTAEALGLTLPPAILIQATEFIE